MKFQSLSLDPRKGLLGQPLLWASLFIPILFGIVFGVPVWSKYSLAFDPEAYQNFLNISQLPLAIMALAIPLTALIARAHATSQTAHGESQRDKIAIRDRDDKLLLTQERIIDKSSTLLVNNSKKNTSNDNILWVQLAKNIIKILQYYSQISTSDYQRISRENIRDLVSELAKQLRNEGDGYPLGFYCGTEDWSNEGIPTEQISRAKGPLTSVGSINTDGKTVNIHPSSDLKDSTIYPDAILVVVTFVQRIFTDFDEKFSTKHFENEGNIISSLSEFKYPFENGNTPSMRDIIVSDGMHIFDGAIKYCVYSHIHYEEIRTQRRNLYQEHRETAS